MMAVVSFLLSPVGRWIGAAGVCLLLLTGAYVKGRVAGVHSERAKWVELQRQLVAERQKITTELAAQSAALAEKDAELNRLNEERANAAPADTRPGLDRDAAGRLRSIR